MIRKLHGIKSAVLFKVTDTLRRTNSYSIEHYFIFSQSAIKDTLTTEWGSEGCSRWPYSCRLQPHELFFRVFQASKVKPEAGVERRGEVKTTDFDQIDEKRSPVTNKLQQNGSISNSVIEL